MNAKILGAILRNLPMVVLSVGLAIAIGLGVKFYNDKTTLQKENEETLCSRLPVL